MNEPARLHELLRASAERGPGEPLFVRGKETRTYAEVDLASAKLASALFERGVRKGDRIALVLDGVVEYLIAYYGILKAGAVVAPLSPETRPRALIPLLAHAEVTGAIMDARCVPYLAGQASALPSLKLVLSVGNAPPRPGRGEQAATEALPVTPEPLERVIAEASAELHDGGAGRDDLASITYTSGTTGAPKGVMLSHRNLVANTRAIVEYLSLRSTDRAAMVLPFYYVYGNSILQTHVCAGGSIAVVGSMTFPAAVLGETARLACTGLAGVPSTFARLMQLGSFERYDLGALRYLTQAGAAMSPAMVQRLRQAFPSVQLFVMYGQTEASARLSYVPPDDLDRKIGSAGKAIPGVTLAVVDAEGREVPRGTVGEVVARGDNVMLGYFRDAEASARALRPEGLRTGDLGYMDDEGFLFLVGRESEVIKSGGHRIAPLEIEEALEAFEHVREAGVIGVPDELLGEAIGAYVVPKGSEPLEEKKLLAWCLDQLPRYKVPSFIRVATELPRTDSGKLKRAELRAWFQASSRGDS